MSERRWDLMVLKDFSTLEGSRPNVAGWVPSGLPLHTDAEVLAEMGGERVRWCAKHRAVPRERSHCPMWGPTSGCRIVNAWVVKEADDE